MPSTLQTETSLRLNEHIRKVIRGHLQKRVDAGDPNYV